MDNNNFNEDRLKKLLEDMPKIEDRQDEKHLYNKISNRINKKIKTKRSIPIWVIPSVASAIVILIIVVIAQGSLTNINMGMSGSDQSSENADNSGNMEIAQLPESNNAGMDNAATSIGEEESNENLSLSNSFTSHVIDKEEATGTFIHGVAMDNKSNYLIPITMMDGTNTDNIEDYYTNMNEYFEVNYLGLSEYPLDGITFDINHEQEEVILNIPDNYNFSGAGSSIQSLFERAISLMFSPYGIKTAIINYSGNNGELAMLGNINKFPLTQEGQQIYKYYQSPTTGEKFLVPINTENDIRWALQEMRRGDTDFNIIPSIPNYVYLTAQSNDDQLVLGFSEEVILGNNEESLNMVEALLITAKSYGYKTVRFNFNIDQVGPYNLQEDVEVPTGINPIPLN